MVQIEGFTSPEAGKVEKKKKVSDCRLGEWGLRVYFALCVGQGMPSTSTRDGEQLEQIQEETATGVIVDGQVPTKVVDASSMQNCNRVEVDTHPGCTCIISNDHLQV